MKKFLNNVKKLSENELVCFASMLIAMIYGMYYLDIRNPLEFSLSEIGRFNHALFIVWSLTSGLALLLNIPRFYKRIGYSSKTGKGLLYGGLAALVLTFLNMSRDPVLYWIHVATALVFALLSFVSVAMGLIFISKKDKRYRIITIIFFSLILIDVVFLAIYKQMALYEFIPLILCFVVLFFTNFTDSFKVELKAKAGVERKEEAAIYDKEEDKAA